MSIRYSFRRATRSSGFISVRIEAVRRGDPGDRQSAPDIGMRKSIQHWLTCGSKPGVPWAQDYPRFAFFWACTYMIDPRSTVLAHLRFEEKPGTSILSGRQQPAPVSYLRNGMRSPLDGCCAPVVRDVESPTRRHEGLFAFKSPLDPIEGDLRRLNNPVNRYRKLGLRAPAAGS